MPGTDPFPGSTSDEVFEARLKALFTGESDPFPGSANGILEERLRALFAGEPDPFPGSTGDEILEARLLAAGG